MFDAKVYFQWFKNLC